jgi:hypothetical protein
LIVRVATIALCIATPLAAQDSTSTNGSTSSDVLDQFPVGETLEFDAKYGLLKLGRAAMRVVGQDTVRGESTVHFQFVLSANALGIIRMHDVFDSWVGRNDFESRRFQQKFDEPGQKRTTSYEIFPDSGLYWQEGVDSSMTLSENPLDDAAFFYFVRTLDLVPGTRYEFDNYFRPDRNPVIIEVAERDTIDVPAGRFATVVVKPTIKGGGIFKEGADGRIWITDDDRRLIVQMKAKFGFGTVTLRLTDTDGLREETL